MDQSDDPQELERKIEQAARIASRVSDQTTVERLGAWIEELRNKLRQRLQARRRTRRSVHAPGKFGNRTDALQTATWSFGFRPSPRSASAIGNNRLPQCIGPLGRVPQCLYVSIQLP
jgi:hypothetical protein